MNPAKIQLNFWLPGENPMQDSIGLHRILSGSCLGFCLLQGPMKIIVRILAGAGSANDFW